MTVEYLDLVDYVAIAAEVTGLTVPTLTQVTKLDLADSALHAPSASFGAAWASLRMFIAINAWHWTTTPTIDEAEQAVLAIAAGDWNETRTAEWLRPLIAPTS